MAEHIEEGSSSATPDSGDDSPSAKQNAPLSGFSEGSSRGSGSTGNEAVDRTEKEENDEAFVPPSSKVDLSGLHRSVEAIKKELRKVIVGQEDLIEKLLVAVLADGHVLIEGVPGIAKTLVAKSLARAISVDFSRIQFTPDLMPADVLGTAIFDKEKEAFVFKKGPVFSNIVLVDEINRAPAKTQSALFEIMEERQVTAEGKEMSLSPPFITLATQNPIEQEGTYRLPEAQLDRFLFKIRVNYPDLEEEKEILNGSVNRANQKVEAVDPVLSREDLLKHRDKVNEVHVDEKLVDYIARIVHSTREHPDLFLGASPRASLSLLVASKALAAIKGRDFITPDDIRAVAGPVLIHRVLLTPEKEMEGVGPDKLVTHLIDRIEVPR